MGETRKITIITKDTGRVDAPCGVISTSPKDKTDDIPTEPFAEGYYAYFTPKEKGTYKVKVTFAGKEVPNSPFTVVVEALDISGVQVKGLEKRTCRFSLIIKLFTGSKLSKLLSFSCNLFQFILILLD